MKKFISSFIWEKKTIVKLNRRKYWTKFEKYPQDKKHLYNNEKLTPCRYSTNGKK